MLNKTPKANAKKIRWARNGLAVCLLALASVIIFTQLRGNNTLQTTTDATTQLSTATGSVTLERAETNAQRVQGLSGRSSLADSTGMLFIFDTSDTQCFWMKDMNFNIDMVWADAQKRVLQIKSDVAPSTYPNSFCADNTRYVIELPSGDATRRSITVGQQLQF